jgi:ribosomal protein S8
MMAVLVLIALLLLRNAIRPPEIKPEDFLYENFVNLKNELIKTVDISILNKEDVSTNLSSFIAFSTDVLGRKGYVEDVKFDASTYGNTIEVHMNVTLKLGNSFIEDRFIINRTVYP